MKQSVWSLKSRRMNDNEEHFSLRLLHPSRVEILAAENINIYYLDIKRCGTVIRVG